MLYKFIRLLLSFYNILKKLLLSSLEMGAGI